MPLTRRSLLALGAGGAGLLAVGGVGLALRRGEIAPAPAGLRVLDDHAYAVLAAVAVRMLRADGALPAPRELGIPALVDAHLSTLHPADQGEVILGLRLLDNALTGLVFDGRPRPFTACDGATQDAVIAAWSGSTLLLRRKVIKALRGLIVATYWGHPEVYAAASYPGPPDYGAWPPPGMVPANADAAPAEEAPE